MTQQVYNRILILSVAISLIAEAALGRGVISDDDVGSKINLDLHSNNDTELRLQRIFDGRLAKDDSHRYMAAIEKDNKFTCGGTLIHPEWVLTAAHCMFEYDQRKKQEVPLTKERVRVLLATLRLDDGSGYHIPVAEIITHRYFKNDPKLFSYLDNDIALLRLSAPSNMDPAEKLSDGTDLPILGKKNTCVIAGWGDTKVNQVRQTNELREVYVALMSNKRCRRLLFKPKPGVFEWGGAIADWHICVYGGRHSDRQPGICRGDSGGPLMCGNVLTGVVSFFDCKVNKPSVFTRVSYYRDWIKANCDNCVH